MIRVDFSLSSTKVMLAVALSATAAGCGTNKFQQEVQSEESAIKLAKETIAGDYQLISTAELKKLLDSNQDLLLIDAMPAKGSYEAGHIPGAVNFLFPKEPTDTWDEASMGGKSLEDYAELLGDDKDRLIVAYCGFVKCARSHNAAAFARELGYTNVRRYPGGIYAWKGSGFQLTTD